MDTMCTHFLIILKIDAVLRQMTKTDTVACLFEISLKKKLIFTASALVESNR